MTRAQEVTLALRGKWHGRSGTACCPAHDDRKPSLSLTHTPEGRMLVHCFAGCTYAAVMDALRGLGLVESTGPAVPPEPADLARRRAAEEATALKREAQARGVWDEAVPIKGTLAENYLCGRRITCDLPETLRFHPACWHPSAMRLPALVARVDGAARFAVHRTYLRADGTGKAAMEPAKAMLGAVAGGAVRLAEARGRLVVAEGIETALSLASGLLRIPATIWAALSTSGLTGLTLPPDPARLTIATDGDAAGRAAGNKLAERASALGWSVSLLPAPDGLDWNDLLTGKGPAA